jgi:hypothetical protein
MEQLIQLGQEMHADMSALAFAALGFILVASVAPSLGSQLTRKRKRGSPRIMTFPSHSATQLITSNMTTVTC